HAGHEGRRRGIGRAAAHHRPSPPRAAQHRRARLLRLQGEGWSAARGRAPRRAAGRGGRVAAMRWATRAGCHVDRAACAWVLRRFVDPDAEFVFVEDPADVPADATPFDMRGVELSHHGGDCSFETILRHFLLEDPVLWEVARLVHEADLADDRYDEPGGPGLDVISRGL